VLLLLTFGSAWPERSVTSRVKVDDSLLVEEFKNSLEGSETKPSDIFSIKPGVAIDRVLGTVRPPREALFHTDDPAQDQV